MERLPSIHCCIVCFSLYPGELAKHYSFLNRFRGSDPYPKGALKFLDDDTGLIVSTIQDQNRLEHE